jgi:tRNA (cytidine/uridine-2'-O-)-methyltransferase
MTISIVLFEPDIPQNTGSMIRLAACMGAVLHIIEPCGFLLDNKSLQRVAMDYGSEATIVRHLSWNHFLEYKQSQTPSRLLVFSTRAKETYTAFAFQPGDMILLGRESAGVPDYVVQAADGFLRIPLAAGARSLNVAQAASMALGEALRQTHLFPTP